MIPNKTLISILKEVETLINRGLVYNLSNSFSSLSDPS